MMKRSNTGGAWPHLGISLALVLVLLLLAGRPAAAEKSEWADRSFDFSRLRRVIVLDLDDAEMPQDTILRRRMGDEYIDQAMRRMKCQVIREVEAARRLGPSLGLDLEGLLASDRAKALEIMKENASRIADGWLQGTVKVWENMSYIQPAYTKWEEKTYTRRVRDSDGKTREETYTVTVPVHYPAQKIWYSDIKVAFDVYEARGGKLILSREDDRQRADSNMQDGMFGRICKSFFSDLGSKAGGKAS